MTSLRDRILAAIRRALGIRSPSVDGAPAHYPPPMTWSIKGGPTGVVGSVLHCPACGGSHSRVPVVAYGDAEAVADGPTHWAPCPVTDGAFVDLWPFALPYMWVGRDEGGATDGDDD